MAPSEVDRAAAVAAVVVPEIPDVRRKAQIAWGKATDHGSDVVAVEYPNFDINKTIFQSLEGFLPRKVTHSKLAVQLYWSDKAILEIDTAFAAIPRGPKPEQPMLDFMANECNFAMEHADGSFMDHLMFCAEYSRVHYSQHSPKVLFLHSILGVGTNFFPMEKEKIPQLKSMLTDFEFNQIEAFPTVLRLINHKRIIPELAALPKEKLDKLEKVSFHRVIDNEPIEMSADQFWIQLNFQLIHLLDFLPASNWLSNLDDIFLTNFTDLHRFLSGAGLVQCKVDFDLTQAQKGSDGRPMTLGGFIRSVAPTSVLKKQAAVAIEKFSNKIGHSLDYKLHFAE